MIHIDCTANMKVQSFRCVTVNIATHRAITACKPWKTQEGTDQIPGSGTLRHDFIHQNINITFPAIQFLTQIQTPEADCSLLSAGPRYNHQQTPKEQDIERQEIPHRL